MPPRRATTEIFTFKIFLVSALAHVILSEALRLIRLITEKKGVEKDAKVCTKISESTAEC